MLFLYINNVPRDECLPNAYYFYREAHFEQNQENRVVASVDLL